MGRGGIVWFTGLPSAGKTTLARALVARLAPVRPVELLDGDDVRRFLSSGLSFSREDRDTNIARIAFVARMLARHGVLAIVAAISPYAAARDEAKQHSAREGHPFLEIFVHAPLAVAIARDVKGLYRRALAGEIAQFTGVSDPYEPPAAPALELRTDRESVAACEARLVELLRDVDLLS
ncbi:MAG: adenylyl-sulfate kinase [Kofleriaceae bacterium]|nr:adenylyl-sulfate kinase [Kofleriaceae bacterium]